MKTLLLWDIDGTLINARGSGTAAVCDSVWASFGIKSDLAHIDMGGRTDRWIFQQILTSFQLPQTEHNMGLLEKHYLESLEPQLEKRGVELLPGVREILDAAARREGIVQGLLTGNLIVGAKRKMASHGLWDYFPFGAFSDDAANRNELGPKALERARAHCGENFAIERVWVIGDTPNDVLCGKSFGARTLAVATGKPSLEKLQAEKPCAALKSFADTQAFWDVVMS